MHSIRQIAEGMPELAGLLPDPLDREAIIAKYGILTNKRNRQEIDALVNQVQQCKSEEARRLITRPTKPRGKKD